MRSGSKQLILATIVASFTLADTASAQQSFNEVRATAPIANTTPAKRYISPEMRGDIFMARKMYREAIEAYQEAPQGSAVIANKVGIAHHQMLELDAAKKSYESAIKLDKLYSEAINNLGTVHYARKSYRKAVGQYKKALKLSPSSASIYSNLGTAHFARKKYKDAAECYEKALSLDPEVFEHRNSHGVLLQERSVHERAKFHFYLARTYAKAGNAERALLYMRKALEEGFADRKKFQQEPEFALLQELPEFQQLLTMEPRVL
ncbi:MAG TPA: tetratricopeptide repeat protein [Bryobacteraceae bacterium]|nr:tetratricopeptide repeat protein [Bryobacteraceae bacterium]